MSERIAITGATGFVGSRLVEAFASGGWDVVALSRRPPACSRPGVHYEKFDLAQPEGAALHGADVLVHCAIEPYRGGVSAPSINVAGSAKLFESARRQGVRKIVFISSTAARAQTPSEYGREKYAVEQLLDPSGDLIVRPGLVLGDGGLIRSMFRSLKKLRVAPLFFRGLRPVYTIAIDDLSAAVLDLVSAGRSGLFVLSAQPVTMRSLYQSLARKAGVRIMLAPLPYAPVLAALEIAERCGLSLPLTSGSVRGVAAMEPIDVPVYPDVAGAIRPFSEAIDSIDFTNA